MSHHEKFIDGFIFWHCKTVITIYFYWYCLLMTIIKVINLLQYYSMFDINLNCFGWQYCFYLFCCQGVPFIVRPIHVQLSIHNFETTYQNSVKNVRLSLGEKHIGVTPVVMEVCACVISGILLIELIVLLIFVFMIWCHKNPSLVISSKYDSH